MTATVPEVGEAPAAGVLVDRPEECPQCGTTEIDFAPNHDDGISEGPAWLCTGCRWGQWI